MRMRASFLHRPRRSVDRPTARNSALINQLATPGLGSLLAGRYVAGVGQLILAFAGFGLVIGWFVLRLITVYKTVRYGVEPQPVGWVGEAGLLFFGAAWLWALLTSLSLLREARTKEPPPSR